MHPVQHEPLSNLVINNALGQSTHLRGPTPEVVFSNGKLAHRWKDYSYNGETKLE